VIQTAPPIDADALRLRHEFLSLPDLCVSVDACAQFLDVPPRHARAILESLVEDGFLQRHGDGRYVRAAPPRS
jgi:predicted transcriptional regulator of viral defense system